MDELEWARDSSVFTTRQAATHGLDDEALTAMVRRGAVRRLARGLYGLGCAAERGEDRHLELCRALMLEYEDATLAGRSAAMAHGLPMWDVRTDRALLLRPVARQVRRSGAVIRPNGARLDGVDTPTGPAQAVDRALVQLAIDDGTLAAVVAADHALHHGVVSRQALELEVKIRAGHPRVQRAKAMLTLCDEHTESPGESRLRVCLTSFGIEVEPQFVVRDAVGRLVGRADLRVTGTRVLVEFDGLVKYADGDARTLVAEKIREDRLRALGWVVVRFTWADLASPQRILAAVRRAVAADRLAHASAG